MSCESRTDSRGGHTGRHIDSTTNTVISGTNTTKSTGTATGTGVGTYTTGSTERSTDSTMNLDMETFSAFGGGGAVGGAGGSYPGVGSYPGSSCTVDLSRRSTAVTPIVQAMGGHQRASSSVGAASFVSGSDFGGEWVLCCSEIN